jgi:hypothetical protein
VSHQPSATVIQVEVLVSVISVGKTNGSVAFLEQKLIECAEGNRSIVLKGKYSVNYKLARGWRNEKPLLMKTACPSNDSEAQKVHISRGLKMFSTDWL